jgi:hypothetical protein
MRRKKRGRKRRKKAEAGDKERSESAMCAV